MSFSVNDFDILEKKLRREAPALSEEQLKKRCTELIKQLRLTLRCKLPIGQRRSHEERINRLLAMRRYSQDKMYLIEGESAFKSRISTFILNNVSFIDPKLFLQHGKDIVLECISEKIKEFKFVKINLVFCGMYVKNTNTEDIKYINIKSSVLKLNTNLENWYNIMCDKLLTKLEEFSEADSGFALESIINLTININKYAPMRANKYIKEPLHVREKNAVLNIKNTDTDDCFMWCIVAGLFPILDKNEATFVENYPHYRDVLEVGDLKMPIMFNDIEKFEDLNDISVNVYIIEKKKK